MLAKQVGVLLRASGQHGRAGLGQIVCNGECWSCPGPKGPSPGITVPHSCKARQAMETRLLCRDPTVICLSHARIPGVWHKALEVLRCCVWLKVSRDQPFALGTIANYTLFAAARPQP